ncbi:MAG: HTH marR-type domain-containing protein [Burkholderia sp.]|jgi:DNA-binding MarR family transcriptional regulator
MGILDTWQRAQVMLDALSARIEETLAPSGISVREWIMLRVLGTQHEGTGGHYKMKDLAVLAGLSQSATTRLVTRLEDRGLLVRYICKTDRRGIYTAVTPEGEKLLKETEPAVLALFEKLGLGKDEALGQYLKSAPPLA